MDYEFMEIGEDVSYMELPVAILEYKEKALRNKMIPFVKV